MNECVISPQYFKIALDIAARIARGELQEGQKMYGRSILSAEYGVSSETIRRALKLLSDMGIVEVRPRSCAVIISMAKAQTYVGRFTNPPKSQELYSELKGIVSEYALLGRRIIETAGEIAKIHEGIADTAPFSNYEAEVPGGGRAVGKSLGELHFWQATGATVIAIRREGSIVLSPGPYAQLMEKDILVFVGGSTAVQAVSELLHEGI